MLQVLHQPPVIVHRDIRWPNLVQSRENSLHWILIDWETSSKLPTTAQSNFETKSHPVRVFQDNHGPEVDVWAVGHILTHAADFIASYPREVFQLGNDIKSTYMTVTLNQVEEKLENISRNYPS
jgi:serine/threonine protein kinase